LYSLESRQRQDEHGKLDYDLGLSRVLMLEDLLPFI